MKTFGKILAAGLVALLVGLQPTESRAGYAYGVTFFGDQLITIDTTTGLGSVVGNLSTPMSPFGLAFGGGNLYSFDSTNDVITQISTATGGTQSTYNIGLTPGQLLGQGGLAFQNATVGFLTSALDPSTFNTVNDLYMFNIATGKSTLIAHTADTLEALAFSSTGVLYGLGKNDGDLYTVNTTTGAMALVGNVGVSIGSPTGGLAFAPNGTLYATLDDALYTLNTTTGQATPVGGMATYNGYDTISGLAFTPGVVPEPSSLVLCGMFLATAGGYGLIRRRKPI
jgi:hypothetical protein